MTTDSNLEKLMSLQTQLKAALQSVDYILDMYHADGLDSLANIEYGAMLNTELHEATQLFNALDDAGLFTMGDI